MELQFSCRAPLAVGDEIFATPARVFAYYIWPNLRYLVSPASKGRPDDACAFPRRVVFRAKHDPDSIRSVWPQTRSVLKHLACNQDFYDADPDIYGDLKEQCEAAIAEVERLLGEPGS